MPAKILAAAKGMAWHLWPALDPRDALIVPVPPPREFLEYLSGLGMTPPRFVTETDPAASAPPDSLFTPFGWNDEAVRRNAGSGNPVGYPAPGVVRRVNSRAFGLELERALFPETACPATFCPDRDSLARWLAAAPPGRYVAKGNHGHAGIGQLRFVLPRDRDARAARLSRLLERHGGLVIEEEQRVGREWGLLFRLGRDGSIPRIRYHRLLSGPAGGYEGALVLPGDDPEFAPHRAAAESAALRIAEALQREGYFGPVGLDLYRHDSGASGRLRSLVDLNARMSMAFPAHGLAARFPGRAVLCAQVSATSPGASGVGVNLCSIRDNLTFDLQARRGVLRITPPLPLPRHSLAFVGGDEEEVTGLRRAFFRSCGPLHGRAGLPTRCDSEVRRGEHPCGGGSGP